MYAAPVYTTTTGAEANAVAASEDAPGRGRTPKAARAPIRPAEGAVGGPAGSPRDRAAGRRPAPPEEPAGHLDGPRRCGGCYRGGRGCRVCQVRRKYPRITYCDQRYTCRNVGD